MPALHSASVGLASELSEFVPPAPTASSLSAALLAETRDELETLAKAADRAAATCLASAPLAEALRSAVMRELAQIEIKQAAMASQPDGVSDFSLHQRIIELRASAAQGLELLRGALESTPAVSTANVPAVGADDCQPTSPPPAFASLPRSLGSPQRPTVCSATALPQQRDLSNQMPFGVSQAAPRAASPLPRASGRRQLSAQAFQSPLPSIYPSAAPDGPPSSTPLGSSAQVLRSGGYGSPVAGSPAASAAARLAPPGSGDAPPLSPPLAAALGGVAADMRQALSEIRSARRAPREPRETSVLSPLGGRAPAWGGAVCVGDDGRRLGLHQPLTQALWLGVRA